MTDEDLLANRFEEHRPRLRAMAYRMLGSLAEADDAVQDAWLRLSQSRADVQNLAGWLTTVVARVCLDMLRSRKVRGEEPLEVHVPDMLINLDQGPGPEEEAMLADSVGLALLVVLDTLTPAERLAFVLHDMFDLPFEQIADIVGRGPAATRQLASRARRRVREAAPDPDPDLALQAQVVDAFFAAARGGDFEALVSVLDPEIVLRTDAGAARPVGPAVLRGPAAVAAQALMFANSARVVWPALVNGAAGVVITAGGRPVSVMAFTVVGGTIVEINTIRDPERLSRLGLAIPGD